MRPSDASLAHARAFHRLSPWRDVCLDEPAVQQLFKDLQAADHAYFDSDADGMIGGVLTPLFFNPSILMAAELFWYSAKPGRGRTLREGFERWAKEKGAHFVQFSALIDEQEDRVRSLLTRSGYQPVEIGVRKVLSWQSPQPQQF